MTHADLPTPTAELGLAAIVDSAHPIKTQAAEFARGALNPPDMVERDRDLVFNQDAWQALADRGVLGMLVPDRFGGSPTDLITALLTLEGIGLGCVDNGLGFALASQMLSFQETLVRFGNDEQRTRFLPGLCSGSLLGAFAITEPDSGSDSFAMATKAERVDDEYVLHGRKAHVTLAPIADLTIVFASTRPDAGAWGVSAFLIETDRPGVEVSTNQPKMGLRTTPYGDLKLTGCRVPAQNLLGSEGSGAAMFTAALALERGTIFATQLGALERFLDRSVAYARERHQFGEPIGNFQSVSNRIVDAKVALETSRLLMYKSALLLADGADATMATAMSKLHSAESIASASLDLVRTFGALGYRTGHEAEREVRDALGGLVYGGTSDIQRNIVARLLGVTR